MGGFRNLDTGAPELAVSEVYTGIGAVGLALGPFDTRNLGSILVAALYHPDIATPADGDYLRFQFMWYDSLGANLLGVDTFEVQSDKHIAALNGKYTFIRSPIRGSVLTVVSNTGTANSVLTFKLWQSRDRAAKFVMWQDTTDFTVTDGWLARRAQNPVTGGASTTFFLPAYCGNGILRFAATGGIGQECQFQVRAGGVTAYNFLTFDFLLGGDQTFLPIVYPRRPLRVFISGPPSDYGVFVDAYSEELSW